MKTYEELEREAYINGDVKLAEAYAVAADADSYDYLKSELGYANDRLSEIASIVAGY